MDIVTGAIANLIPKLGALLAQEYKLHKGVKKNIEDLWKELESMNVALIKIGEVPWDQLDKQDKLWADDVRELSYVIEDVVDKFLIRVDHIQPDDTTNKFKGLMKRTTKLLKKVKDKYGIAHAIKDIQEQLQKVAARRDRNKVVVPNPTEPITIDPCLRALYAEATELVGIYGKRDQELMRLLSMEGDDASKNRLKKVSIVGFGGLGKTTLARAVYEKIKGDFDCRAFVPVGQNPDMKKVLRDILIDLGNSHSDLAILDANQLIKKLHDFLENRSNFARPRRRGRCIAAAAPPAVPIKQSTGGHDPGKQPPARLPGLAPAARVPARCQETETLRCGAPIPSSFPCPTAPAAPPSVEQPVTPSNDGNQSVDR